MITREVPVTTPRRVSGASNGRLSGLEAQAEGKFNKKRKEVISHLVQDNDLISRIHSEELPPDAYYEELTKVLQKKIRKCKADLITHVVAVVAAFDTAAAFGLSFGIQKFQLAQTP